MDNWDETPTKVETYETLSEVARKWREEMRREKLQGHEVPETSK